MSRFSLTRLVAIRAWLWRVLTLALIRRWSVGIGTFIHDTMTDAEGTPAPVRFAWILTMVTFWSLTIYTVVWVGKDFDPSAYALAGGGLLATGGVGIWIGGEKQKPIPEEDKEPK